MILVDVKICMSLQLTNILVKDVLNIKPVLSGTFSAIWHCWLGHLTRKIVSEMTYNVSSGTLNTTIPYLYYLEPTARSFKGSFICQKLY